MGTNDTGGFKSILCNKYVVTEKDLALHRFFIHQEAPFICRADKCNVSYWKRMSLMLHDISVHKMQQNKTCKICSIVFSGYREKQLHIKLYHPSEITSVKPFVCEICNRRFCYESALKTHKVIHSDINMYKCDLCGKEFKLKLTLSKHIQFHQKKQLEENKTCLVTVKATAVTETDIAEAVGNYGEPLNEVNNVCALVNSSGVFNVCDLFKCPDCSILFTHKETRDAHYLETHGEKQTVSNQATNVYELITITNDKHLK